MGEILEVLAATKTAVRKTYGQNMRLIAERLKSEARNGRTILVITHDHELIESCCDNVVEVGTKPSEVQ